MKRGNARLGVQPRAWPPVQGPLQAHDWVGAEEVLRIALGAFYAAVADAHHEWDSECDWLDHRQCFADELVLEFTERLQQLQHQLGLPDPGGHHRDAAKRLQMRDLDRLRAPAGSLAGQQNAVLIPSIHQSAGALPAQKPN